MRDPAKVVAREPVPFNVNWNVKVRLTERGLMELRRQHKGLRAQYPRTFEAWRAPETDADGYATFQLHVLMHDLGALCFVGADLPFETGILLLPDASAALYRQVGDAGVLRDAVYAAFMEGRKSVCGINRSYSARAWDESKAKAALALAPGEADAPAPAGEPAYEVLPDIKGQNGEDVLSASYTANNGIRIQVQNDDLGPDWAVFDFEPEQARTIGEALLRWSGAPAPARSSGSEEAVAPEVISLGAEVHYHIPGALTFAPLYMPLAEFATKWPDVLASRLTALKAALAEARAEHDRVAYILYHTDFALVGLTYPDDGTKVCIGTNGDKFRSARKLRDACFVTIEDSPAGPLVGWAKDRGRRQLWQDRAEKAEAALVALSATIETQKREAGEDAKAIRDALDLLFELNGNATKRAFWCLSDIVGAKLSTIERTLGDRTATRAQAREAGK